MLILSNWKRAVLYGFFIWLFTFAASFLIFPLREDNLALFEAVIPVFLTLFLVVFAVLYFQGVKAATVSEGIVLGITWLVISLVVDLILFLPESPMQMSFNDYMMDIGVTYLMIPIVTIGFAYFGTKLKS